MPDGADDHHRAGGDVLLQRDAGGCGGGGGIGPGEGGSGRAVVVPGSQGQEAGSDLP